MTEVIVEPLTELTFTPDRTRALLHAACKPFRLDPAGATLLRHHTNAVYRLVTAPVVVKIARPGIQHTATVVRLARWLADHDVPGVSLLDDIDQPSTLAGCAITFWRYLPQVRPIAAGDIAGPLAALHAAAPPPFALPSFEPIRAIQRSLAANRVLHDDEQELVRERCSDLATKLATVQFDRPNTLIHGDAQHRNTLWDNDVKRAVLCDWESAVIGPPEWDLTTIEVHCRRFGHDPTEYHDFCARYGFDIRDWPGYSILREVKELRMIATNARKSTPGSAEAAEVRRRVGILDADSAQRWWIL